VTAPCRILATCLGIDGAPRRGIPDCRLTCVPPTAKCRKVPSDTSTKKIFDTGRPRTTETTRPSKTARPSEAYPRPAAPIDRKKKEAPLPVPAAGPQRPPEGPPSTLRPDIRPIPPVEEPRKESVQPPSTARPAERVDRPTAPPSEKPARTRYRSPCGPVYPWYPVYQFR
jgi:hypothetical protein